VFFKLGHEENPKEKPAYWSGRFRSYDQPKIPLRCTSGSGAGASLISA
jgi:hypothetical protein